jgi:CRISPR-associated protein Csm5
MTQFDLKISVISPLHIGNGEELRADFDFICSGSKTYRLDVDAVLLDFEDEFVQDLRGGYPTPGDILRKRNALSNRKYYRYVLKGTPRSSKSDARIQACIKDVYDNPYLPGSSLKGAFRTALAWTGWSERNIKLSSSSLNRRKYWAGQKIEKSLFGKEPNSDLLRALHISDCFTDQAKGSLAIANAQVLTKHDIGAPVELEAIVGDIVFSGSLTIDEFLFSEQAEQQLHLSDRKHWLSELLIRTQKHSHARIKAMLDWYNGLDEGSRVYNFLNQLSHFTPGPDQALMQIGWGTGWDGKTFWTHLKQDEYIFEKILKDYRMVRKGRRETGDVFPKSRRVVMQSKGDVAQPLAPFGWALVELEK